jgi:hypothetical protein
MTFANWRISTVLSPIKPMTFAIGECLIGESLIGEIRKPPRIDRDRMVDDREYSGARPCDSLVKTGKEWENGN